LNKAHFLMSGSSRLGPVISRESSNNIQRDPVANCKFSSKWQKIRRFQWPLQNCDFKG